MADEQPVIEPKDKPENKPAPAKVDERINLRRDIITTFYLTVQLFQIYLCVYAFILSRKNNIFFVLVINCFSKISIFSVVAIVNFSD